MPRLPLPDEAVAMLGRPNPAVIATLRPDGQPVSVATWYLWEDGRVMVNMDEGRRRLGHLRHDPRVTLTVLDEDSWYTHLSLVGRVTEMYDDTGLTDIDRLSRRYLGHDYTQRGRGRVTAWIEVDRWHGWGAFRTRHHRH
ncbi:PPOX class F420-dependent oxidoreductase [Kitasatospora sp. NPDC051914]|uniref:PPOX class F420-dependent oxidoreductase n=1 Tax=Kitasatospora sp. NPDC051914 TaxID=3154945 RepID=UPI003426A932